MASESLALTPQSNDHEPFTLLVPPDILFRTLLSFSESLPAFGMPLRCFRILAPLASSACCDLGSRASVKGGAAAPRHKVSRGALRLGTKLPVVEETLGTSITNRFDNLPRLQGYAKICQSSCDHLFLAIELESGI